MNSQKDLSGANQQLYRLTYGSNKSADNNVILGKKYSSMNTYSLATLSDLGGVDYEQEKISDIKEKSILYIDQLTPILNDIHGVDKDFGYWKFALLPFFTHFLSFITDRLVRYHDLVKCAKTIDGTNTVFNIPTTTNDYVSQSKTEGLDFVAYYYMSAHFGNEDQIKWSVSVSKAQNQKNSVGYLEFLLKKFYLRLWKPVILFDSYWPAKDKFKAFFLSKGRLLNLPSRLFLTSTAFDNPDDLDSRKKIKIEENDLFDSAANSLLPVLLPKSFIEDYADIIKKNRDFATHLQSVGTAVAIYSNDRYNLLNAELLSAGKDSYALQHGGGYRVLENKLSEWMEDECSTLAFGWNRLSVNKLRKLWWIRHLRKYASKKTVLFVQTSFSKFLYRYELRENSNNYLFNRQKQVTFINHLESSIRANFKLRLYPRDFGWDDTNYFSKEVAGEISYDLGNYYRSLVGVQLYVSDHLTTTWIEALWLDIPVILIIDRSEYDLNSEFSEVFNAMAKAYLIHSKPEDAARFINSNFDIDAWWESKDVVDVRNKIKDYFSPNTALTLSQFLKKIECL